MNTPTPGGVQPNMYRGRVWTMRQYSGYATAADTNQRFRYLLEQGQNGLSVAFDLPTQIGYDSDHVFAQGEVGKVGVPRILSASGVEPHLPMPIQLTLQWGQSLALWVSGLLASRTHPPEQETELVNQQRPVA